MKNIFSRHSIKFFMSFITVSLPILLISFLLVHMYFIPTLSSELAYSDHQTMLQLKQQLDLQFNHTNTLYNLIKNDTNFFSPSNNTGYDHYVKTSKLIQLSNLIPHNIDIALFDLDANQVYSTAGYIPITDYFSLYYKFKDTDLILSAIRNTTTQSLIDFSPVSTYTSLSEKYIALNIHSLSPTKKLAFLIEASSFNSLLLPFNHSSSLYVLDYSLAPMLSTPTLDNDYILSNLHPFIQSGVASLNADTDVYFTELPEHQTMMLSSSHEFPGIYCLITNNLRQSTLLKPVYLSYFITFILLLILQLLLSILFSRLHYRPIKQLKQSITTYLHSSNTSNYEDDFKIISTAFTHLLEENLTSKSHTEQKLLYLLLRGTYMPSTDDTFYIKLTQRFGHPFFIVVSIPLKTDFSLKDFNREFLSIHSNFFIKEVFNRDKTMLNLVVNFLYSPDSYLDALKSYLPPSYLFGVGSVVDSLEHTSNSFSTSLISIAMSHTTHQSNYSYDHIPQSYINMMDESKKLRGTILDYINSCQLDSCYLSLDHLFALATDSKMIQYQYIYLLSDLLFLCEKIHFTGFNSHSLNYLLVENISISLAKNILRQVLLDITDYIGHQHSTVKLQLKYDILNYVNLQYTDPALTSSRIAGYFGLSESHFQKYFKESTQNTFSSYLDEVRLENALKLLVNSDMYVKDIVTTVGYVDVNNFIRKFKKIHNVPPQKYRELYKLPLS
ncbi:MAG: helix-turn-helix transcriptional regulator [Cellulosilyticaceae bacterium]